MFGSRLNPWLQHDLENEYAKEEIGQCKILRANSGYMEERPPGHPLYEGCYAQEAVYRHPTVHNAWVSISPEVEEQEGEGDVYEYVDEGDSDEDEEQQLPDIRGELSTLKKEYVASVERLREAERSIDRCVRSARKRLHKISIKRQLERDIYGFSLPETIQSYEMEIKQRMNKALQEKIALQKQVDRENRVQQLITADIQSLVREWETDQGSVASGVQTSNENISQSAWQERYAGEDETDVGEPERVNRSFRVSSRQWLIESTDPYDGEETWGQNNNNISFKMKREDTDTVYTNVSIHKQLDDQLGL